MNPNIGPFDRAARLIIGLVLLAYAIPIGFPETGWNWVGWVGIVPILTAVFSFCPLYTVLGFSTSNQPHPQ